MSRKMYRIASEGDMEDVLKVFITLSKSKVKQKTINIQVPTDKFSDIILFNVNRAFRQYDLGDPTNYHVHIFVEKGNDEQSIDYR